MERIAQATRDWSCVRIPQAALQHALSETREWEDATLSIGTIGVSVQSGTHSFTLTPQEPKFATRGAKEVSFLVTSSDTSCHRLAKHVTSILGGLIAQATWPPLFASSRHTPEAIAELGQGVARCDLRSARASVSANAAFVLQESIGLREIRVADGCLILKRSIGTYR